MAYKTFSERMKIVIKEPQFESMSEGLKNSLWNVVFKSIGRNFISYSYKLKEFFQLMIMDFFKIPIDKFDYDIGSMERYYKLTRTFFMDELDWNEVYDLLEFLAMNLPKAGEFIEECNKVLEREMSAYRFIGTELIPIMNKQEKEAIGEAIEESKSIGLDGVSSHLRKSLIMLSNRKSPDYPNSVKESISAVESIANIITGKKNASLGEALKEIDKKINIHGALQEGFRKIYGYTSSEGGIRHAMLKEPKVDFEDAKYMLVSCSAFVNYLLDKSRKAGINLSKKL